MEDVKCPQIENLQEITPEQAAEYVRFVATMRHNQRRYFSTRNRMYLNCPSGWKKNWTRLMHIC